MVFIPDIVSQILWLAGMVMAFFALGCAWFVWHEGQKRENAEDAAAEAAAPWLAFDSGHEWLVYVDRDGVVQGASASFITAMGVDGARIIGKHIAAVLAPRITSTQPLHILDAAMRAGAPARAVLDTGGRKLLMAGHPWYSDNTNTTVKGYRLLTADITPEQQRITDLQKLAYTDALTGLGNRAWLLDQIAQTLESKGEQSQQPQITSTKDGFALITFLFPRLVTMPPEQVEMFMLNAAQRLRDAADVAHVSVARTGTESLAALVPSSDCKALASEWGAMLAAPISLPERDAHIAPAIGISTQPSRSTSPEIWLHNTETAARTLTVYNRPLVAEYQPAMHDTLARQRAMATDLRRTVYFTPEQLQCHYRPVYELATRTLTGVELVPTWQHPVWGTVNAADLLSLAETADATAPLWVALYVRALDDIKQWQARHGHAPHLHITMAPALFAMPNLMATMDTLARVTGVDPTQVDLTITANTDDHARDQMLALRARGFGLALNNGSSAPLDILRTLPITAITIGTDCVSALHTNAAAAPIAGAVIALAQSLGHRARASGIGSAADIASLTALGCTYGSGPYFGHDLTANGVDVLLKA
jgi:predicted signal transduction protein with EAL and GGDEF domain